MHKKISYNKEKRKKGEIIMQLTFLGCGDAFSDSDVLGNNSALVEFNGTNLLIDIPDSNYSRIKHIDKTYADIEHIFITHLHGDHINGLERIGQYQKYAKPIVKPGADKAHLYVPEELYFGLWDSVKQGLGVTHDGMVHLDQYFHVHLVKESFTIAGVTFDMIPATHVKHMPVYGLRVLDMFYFSADAVYEKGQIDNILKDFPTELIFHDMHCFQQHIPVHASIRDFSHYSETEKQRLFAMHYDDKQKSVIEIDGIRLVRPYQPYTLGEGGK